MEKTKNELPYYLKIENETRIRFISYFTRNALISFLGFIAFCAAAYYQSVSNVVVVYREPLNTLMPYISVFLILLFGISSLYYLFSSTTLELESGKMLVKTRRFFSSYEREIRREDLSAVRIESEDKLIDHASSSSKLISELEHDYQLTTYLVDGERLELLSGLTHLSHAIILRDFINNYYGLDEKPKTSNE